MACAHLTRAARVGSGTVSGAMGFSGLTGHAWGVHRPKFIRPHTQAPHPYLYFSTHSQLLLTRVRARLRVRVRARLSVRVRLRLRLRLRFRVGVSVRGRVGVSRVASP